VALSASARIPTVLCLDAEDIIAPASDDAALWMAHELADHGLRANFFVMGELARRWVRRGRGDVISALQRHDIGFHSTWHSVHPTTTEICLDLDTRAGIDALWAHDQAGWDDTERIFERPLLGWARTGGSWAPSVMPLMARLGRCYAYSPVQLPEHNVCWYGGCLGFHGEAIGGFDSTFADPQRFAAKLRSANRQIDAYAASERRGAEWLCIFVCHPTRAIHTTFWDEENFAGGANPPAEEWKPAPVLPADRIPTVKDSFRRLCESLRDDDRLEIVGLSELVQRYSTQSPYASHDELLAIARQIARAGDVTFTERFDASELLLMMCQAVAEPARRYTRTAALGPLTTPAMMQPAAFDADAVRAAAHCVGTASKGGYLPSTVTVSGTPVGISTFFVLIASTLAGDPRPIAASVPAWPPEADRIAAEVENTIQAWTIHPKDMDLTKLLEQTRLQCWTLKPASA
jgi:hypothetical protein